MPVVRSTATGCLAASMVWGLFACTGQVGETSARAADGRGGEPKVAPGGPGPMVEDEDGTKLAIPRGGVRRLSRSELDGALRALLGETRQVARQRLAEENMDKEYAFDNNYELNRQPSQNYVEALEGLVEKVTADALADATRKEALLACTPQDAGDVACFRRFVDDFGRRAFRRPLEPDETERFVALSSYGREAEDVFVGISAAIRAMLVSPEFVYRLEVGDPVPGQAGVFKLNAYERASRLSFTLLGAPPDAWLLDAAERGELDQPDGMKKVAQELLRDQRARERLHDYHANWLGYRGSLPAALAQAMLEETNALIDRVVFDDDPDYTKLFLADETFVGDELRAIYGDMGAAKEGRAGWVTYGDSGRAGILSHGSVLSAFKTGDDSSPTKRGWFVRMRLLCEHIAEPPPEVQADVSVAQTQCKTGKEGFYEKSHQGASCRGCHELVDPIGFGLEAYDVVGRKRAHDMDKPDCPIEGKGYVAFESDAGDVEQKSFSGPGELARVLVDSGKLAACVARHVYRFTVGREEDVREEETIAQLEKSFGAGKRSFLDLLVATVSHPAFGFRAEGTRQEGDAP